MRFSNLVLSSTFSVRTLRFVTILPALCRLVGTDDVLHQLVAHHIPVGEFADGDVVHLPQDTEAMTRPLFCLSGRSIWVVSPVMTIRLPSPRRVRNIFICSPVVFCASSRMIKALSRVRPRIYARERLR